VAPSTRAGPLSSSHSSIGDARGAATSGHAVVACRRIPAGARPVPPARRGAPSAPARMRYRAPSLPSCVPLRQDHQELLGFLGAPATTGHKVDHGTGHRHHWAPARVVASNPRGRCIRHWQEYQWRPRDADRSGAKRAAQRLAVGRVRNHLGQFGDRQHGLGKPGSQRDRCRERGRWVSLPHQPVDDTRGPWYVEGDAAPGEHPVILRPPPEQALPIDVEHLTGALRSTSPSSSRPITVRLTVAGSTPTRATRSRIPVLRSRESSSSTTAEAPGPASRAKLRRVGARSGRPALSASRNSPSSGTSSWKDPVPSE